MSEKINTSQLDTNQQEILDVLDQAVDPNLQNDEWQSDMTESGHSLALRHTANGNPDYYDQTRSFTAFEDQESGQKGSFNVSASHSEDKSLLKKRDTQVTRAGVELRDDKTHTTIHRSTDTKSTLNRKGGVKSSQQAVRVNKTTTHGAPRGEIVQTYEAKISPEKAEQYGELLTKLALKKTKSAVETGSDNRIEKEPELLIK